MSTLRPNPPWLRPLSLVVASIFALLVIACQDGDVRRFWVQKPFAVRLPYTRKHEPPQPPRLFVGKTVVREDREQIEYADEAKWLTELPFGRLAVVGRWIVVDHDVRFAPKGDRIAKINNPHHCHEGFSLVDVESFQVTGFDTIEAVRQQLQELGETSEIRLLTYDEWEEIDRPRPPFWQVVLLLIAVTILLGVILWFLWVRPLIRGFREWFSIGDEPPRSNGSAILT